VHQEVLDLHTYLQVLSLIFSLYGSQSIFLNYENVETSATLCSVFPRSTMCCFPVKRVVHGVSESKYHELIAFY